MDLSKLFEYDDAFPIEIKNPVTGDPVGITIYARSAESESVTRAIVRVQAKRMKAAASGEDFEVSDYSSELEREALVASIVRWDFGDNQFAHLNAESPCSDENKAFLITHPNAKWIREQIKSKIDDISNFTKAPKKPARATSKK